MFNVISIFFLVQGESVPRQHWWVEIVLRFCWETTDEFRFHWGNVDQVLREHWDWEDIEKLLREHWENFEIHSIFSMAPTSNRAPILKLRSCWTYAFLTYNWIQGSIQKKWSWRFILLFTYCVICKIKFGHCSTRDEGKLNLNLDMKENLRSVASITYVAMSLDALTCPIL